MPYKTWTFYFLHHICIIWVVIDIGFLYFFKSLELKKNLRLDFKKC